MKRFALLLCSALTVARRASAEEAVAKRVKFRYTFPEGAGCPAEDTTRNAVSARLGYDPFDATSESPILSARIERRNDRLVATIELAKRSGASVGRRELASTGDCAELGAALGLALSMVIDPKVGSRPPVPAAPAIAEKETPAGGADSVRHPAVVDRESAAATRPPQAAEPISIGSSVGTNVSLGLAPSASLGFSAQFAARFRWASLAIEGRADLPSSSEISGRGVVRSSVVLASLIPCLHYRFVYGCAFVSIGALEGAGVSVDHPNQRNTLYAMAGERVGARMPITSLLSVGAHLDLQATLTRTTLKLDGVEAWTTPPISGTFGFDITARFFDGIMNAAELQSSVLVGSKDESNPGVATAPKVAEPEFRALFEREASFVWNSLRRLGAKTTDLDDLSQEVFLTVYRRWVHFDKERPLRPWLFGIAYRVLCHHRELVRHKHEVIIGELERTDARCRADDQLIAEEARQLLLRALDALNLERRAVFIMHDIDGYGGPEIAKELGVPLNTAYSQLRLARDDLRREVARLRARHKERA